MTTAYIRRIDTLDGKKSTITWMVDGAGYSMGCDVEQADIIMQASNSDRAEIERLKQREKHFASVLSVADGGQYRNDWDAAIKRLVRERDAARAENSDLLEAAKAALAALSQAATFPSDIVAAKKWLSDAIAKSEGAKLEAQGG